MVIPDRRVGILWCCTCYQVNTASVTLYITKIVYIDILIPDVGQLGLVYLAHLPDQHLAHRVKTILALHTEV